MNRNTWVCLYFQDSRQYAGNTGYEDEPGVSYVFDSFVPNHKRIRPGDLLLIRDPRSLLGIGVVEHDLPPENRSNPRVRVSESEKGEIWLAGNTHLNRSSASCAR